MSQPNKWLIAYNSISASLWSIVLFNTVFLSLTLGQPYVFEKPTKPLLLYKLWLWLRLSIHY